MLEIHGKHIKACCGKNMSVYREKECGDKLKFKVVAELY